jgi:hypothetical protein
MPQQSKKCELSSVRLTSEKKNVQECIKKYVEKKEYICARSMTETELLCGEKNQCDKIISGKKDCECNCGCSEDRCCKLLYSIAAWADDMVTSITFIPKCRDERIVWTTIDGSLTSGGLFNGSVIVGQIPIASPLFPLKVCYGDKFEITYINNLGNRLPIMLTPNAIAVAANLDGVTLKSFKPSLTPQPDQLILTAKDLGDTIVDPSGTPIPVTESSTNNVVNTPNYVAVSPNRAGLITVVWTLCF